MAPPDQMTAPTPGVQPVAPVSGPASTMPGDDLLREDRLRLGMRKAELEAQRDRAEQESRDEDKNAQLQRESFDKNVAPIAAALQQSFKEANPGVEPPRYNIDHFMEMMPFLALIGALGGAHGRVSGMAGISSINGMISGLVKGDSMRYDAAQTQYEDAMKAWNERAQHMRSIYAEMVQVYKGDQMSTLRAKQAALRVATGATTEIGKVDQLYNTLDVATTRAKMVWDKQQKAYANANPAMSEGSIGMVMEGAPPTAVVRGFGRQTMGQWQRYVDAATGRIAQENHMTLAEAGAELARRQSDYLATRTSDRQLTTMLGATRPALAQLEFNIQQASDILKTIPSTDLSPILNSIARGEERWTGDPQYSSLHFFLSGVAMEAARLMSGGQASIAQLHEGARLEAQRWVDINMTPASFMAPTGVGASMIREGHNRIANFEDAIIIQRKGSKDFIQPTRPGQEGGGGGPLTPAPGAAPPVQPTGPTATNAKGEKIRWNGTAWVPDSAR